MIKCYSLNKDGETFISPNFRVREFRCKDGSDTIFIDDDLVAILQSIRTHFDKAVDISSGYRTDAHNRSIKNASEFSQHLYGRAADISITGVKARDIYNYADKLMLAGGLECHIADNFVHVDVRDVKWRSVA